MEKSAILIARQAGDYLLKEFKKISLAKIKTKSKYEIVTPADLKSEKFIVDAIRKKYPKHQILSEESGFVGKKSEYLWVIDPLDGTTNFAMKNPLWAISLGLWHNSKAQLGIVYAPALEELYFASLGKGAWLGKSRLRVSLKNKINKSLLTFCHSHFAKDVKKITKLYTKFKLVASEFRQLGSASIELAFVASGRTEAIMIPGAHPWDVASGALLVWEAGGQVTDFQKEKWNLKSNDMLASNGLIHNKLIKTINQTI